MPTARRKPRSDALKNRERLIEAARDILGRGGPGASLEAVAREAGVGIGTLYRHFPAREDLFQAVYRREIAQLSAMAADLEQSGNGLEALRTLVHALVDVVETKRGLLGALAVVPSETSKEMYAESTVSLKDAVGRLMQRATADDTMRPGLTVDDLLSTVFALCYARPPEEGWKKRVLHLIDIFIDGLRAG